MTDTIKRASWLELFYDLVFVALVAQLTYAVADYHSTWLDWFHVGIVGYLIFFAWLGTTVSRNLGEEENTIDRLLVQLQMVFAFSMSLSLVDVFAGQFDQFLMGYVLVRLVQVFLIMRVNRQKPEEAPKTNNILQGVMVALALVFAATLVPAPYAYILIVMGIVLEIAAPLTKGKGNKPRMLNVHHLQERLGLFLMLVIGESVLVVAIANTAAGGESTNPLVVVAGLIMMMAFWWTYFRHLEVCGSGLRPKNMILYLHAHAWLFGSVVLAAAGFKNLLKHTELLAADVALLVGGVFIFACMSFLIRGQLEGVMRTGVMKFLIVVAPLVGYAAYLTADINVAVLILTVMTVLWAAIDEKKRLKML